DLHLLLQPVDEVAAPLRQGEALGLRGVEPLVSAEGGEGVHRDEDRGHDDEEDAAFSRGLLSFFHGHDESAPLPALERAESEKETDDGDRYEVDDRARVDEAARKRLIPGDEAHEGDGVSEETRDELRDRRDHLEEEEDEGRQEEGDDLA